MLLLVGWVVARLLLVVPLTAWLGLPASQTLLLEWVPARAVSLLRLRLQSQSMLWILHLLMLLG